MVDLKSWLNIQGLSVKDFALEMEVPLKTAQDWVYRGVVPSAENQGKLAEYTLAHCAHYWAIATPNGPVSEGVCQRCGSIKEFQNSSPEYHWPATKVPGTTEKAVPGKPAA